MQRLQKLSRACRLDKGGRQLTMPAVPLDRRKTMLLINAWPDNYVSPELMVWGYSQKIKRITWYRKRFIEIAYNSAICELALPSECDTFVFADRDVRPGKEAQPLLEVDGEIVACEHPVAANENWDDPQALHVGMFRCSRNVLESIKPPWFERRFSPNGMQEIGCLCQSFRDKALAAGFAVVRAGKVQRDRSKQWPPPLTQQTAW